jgi:hypothetical protein
MGKDDGNYPSKRKAENKARQLRENFPRLKPVRVKKAKGRGYDVYVSH